MSFLFMIFLSAALFVVGQLLMPSPDMENAKRGSVDDFKYPTTSEDRSIPAVWGTNRITGSNVIWTGDFKATAITEKVKVSLTKSRHVVTGHRYHHSFHFALCLGPVDAMSEVRVAKKVVASSEYNGDIYAGGMINPHTPGVTLPHSQTITEPNLFGGFKAGGGLEGTMDFYAGHDNSAVNDYITFVLSRDHPGEETNLPRYSGLCQVVVHGNGQEPCYVGESINVRPWDFVVHRYPNGLGLASQHVQINVDSVDGQGDANAMNVLYEILTDTDFGLGIDQSFLNVPSFIDAAIALSEEDLGFSYMLQSGVAAKTVVEDILEHCNGVLFQDSDGKLTFKLIRADYDIETIPHFNEDNVINFKSVERGAWADTQNTVHVKYVNWKADFVETIAPAYDLGNIQMTQGQQNLVSKKYPGARTETTASVIAQRLLNEVAYPLVRITFETNRDGSTLKPGDVITVTDPDYGLEMLPLRVTEINIGNAQNPSVMVSGVQDVYAHPSYVNILGTSERYDGTVNTTPVVPADVILRGQTFLEKNLMALADGVVSTKTMHLVKTGSPHNDQFQILRLNAGVGGTGLYDTVSEDIYMAARGDTMDPQSPGVPESFGITGNRLTARELSYTDKGYRAPSAYTLNPFSISGWTGRPMYIGMIKTDGSLSGDTQGGYLYPGQLVVKAFSFGPLYAQNGVRYSWSRDETYMPPGVAQDEYPGLPENQHPWYSDFENWMGIPPAGSRIYEVVRKPTEGEFASLGANEDNTYGCNVNTQYFDWSGAGTETTGGIMGRGEFSVVTSGVDPQLLHYGSPMVRYVRTITEDEHMPVVGLAGFNEGSSILNQSRDEIRLQGRGMIQVNDEIMAYETIDTRIVDAHEGSSWGVDVEQTANSSNTGTVYKEQSVTVAGLGGLHRGLVDTSIQDHPEGSTVWFLSTSQDPVEEDSIDENQDYTYKHLTRGHGAQLAEADATPESITSLELRRYQRPLRSTPFAFNDVTRGEGGDVWTYFNQDTGYGNNDQVAYSEDYVYDVATGLVLEGAPKWYVDYRHWGTDTTKLWLQIDDCTDLAETRDSVTHCRWEVNSQPGGGAGSWITVQTDTRTNDLKDGVTDTTWPQEGPYNRGRFYLDPANVSTAMGWDTYTYPVPEDVQAAVTYPARYTMWTQKENANPTDTRVSLHSETFEFTLDRMTLATP